ncbi:hypothetical protein CBR_g28052 [Chara braunii]|uniref:RING-type domain-containing protein n=1 Tax=Chara braunii TaxID=69332 RepID=A0A388L936_CHABU|nr:hypothetical protein CBR_g28052 [Chara braunii]|eukprot:GBG78829.1 hypothetical protein CBR_g28052 [Chara braunii]
MGVGPSVHERLLDAVVKQDWQAIEKCHHDGANLEFTDKKERTALMIACSMEESYHVVDTLLRLGARVDAFKRGPSGGFPIHFAARRGLYRVVERLLEAGAPPNVFNDDGQTPLWIAREKGHWKVVRAFEGRLAVFKGHVKGLAVPLGIMGLFSNVLLARNWYIVVVPIQKDPHLPPEYEFLMYTSEKQAVPKVEIPLSGVSLKIEKEQTSDPSIIVSDSSGGKRFKFFSKDSQGGDAVIRQLYDSCKVLCPTVEPSPSAPRIQGASRERAPAPAMQPTPPPAPRTPDQRPYAMPAESVYPPLATPVPPFGSAAVANETTGFPAHLNPQFHMPVLYPPISQPPYTTEEGEALPESQDSGWQRSRQSRFPTPSFMPHGSDGGWAPEPVGDYKGWGPAWSGQEPATSSGMEHRMPEQFNGWDEPSVLESDWSQGQVASGDLETQEQRGEERDSQLRRDSMRTVNNDDLSPHGIPEETAPSAPPLPLERENERPHAGLHSKERGEQACCGPREPQRSWKTDGGCPICMDNPADAVCVPCGHVAGCVSCLGDIHSRNMGCPVCRADIREVIKMFKV